MRINGEWYLCEDDNVRPVIYREVLTANGSWQEIPFLVDIGADRTVFSAAIMDILGYQPAKTQLDLSGVGGVAESVAITTRIRLLCDDGKKAVFRGQYAAFTELESLDMSVLGRDIMDMFAVITDRPGDVVCLLRGRHKYKIKKV